MVSTVDSLSWARPGEVDLHLDLPPAGVLLGMAVAGDTPVRMACLSPIPSRVGLIGKSALQKMLAYRLLGMGCRVGVATPAPSTWRGIAAKAGPRLVLGDAVRHWPPGQPSPMHPHALVIETSAPPDQRVNPPWTTVIHCAPGLPARSPFWAGTDFVLAGAPGHGRAIAAARGWPDAIDADEVGPGEVALCTAGGTTLFAPAVTALDRELFLQGEK